MSAKAFRFALAASFAFAPLLYLACGGSDASTLATNDAGTDATTSSDAPAGDVVTPIADGAVVLCDQADPNVASPNAPHGIYAVEFKPSDHNPLLVNQPTICGANIFIPWSEVDKGPGASPQYDFSQIDPMITPWKSAGKKVNLLVEGIGLSTKQNVTPDYVLDSGVVNVACASTTPYPLVWTPDYYTPYEAFIAAVLAKYGNDPDIGYIRVGLSTGAQADVTCVPDLADAGLTEDIFETYVSNLVAFERTQPHTVQLMLAIGPYGAGGPKGDISLPDFEAPLAVDAGFGFGNQGWSIADVDASRCNANWCGNFDTFEGRAPLYLQPLANAYPDGGGAGSLTVLIPFALEHHTQIFEIYSADLAVAYDPSSPGASYASTYQALLQSTAAIVGSHP
jgi:hypothetical protein